MKMSKKEKALLKLQIKVGKSFEQARKLGESDRYDKDTKDALDRVAIMLFDAEYIINELLD